MHMLENAVRCKEKAENIKEKTDALEQELSALQQRIREKKLPVILLFEGWGASGKGTLIADVIKLLDPRFFKVYSTMPADESERRYPLMKRFWEIIPGYGAISVLDRSWYRELAIARLEDGISEKEYVRRVDSVNIFERQLSDDGYVIIKFFLQISKKEQKKRFAGLREDSSSKWRVTELDMKRHKNYDEYYEQFDLMLEKTDTPYCRWNVIDASDRRTARFQVLDIIVDSIKNALVSGSGYSVPPAEFALSPCLKLSEIQLDGKTLTPDEYGVKLKKARKELSRLHGRIYKKKIPVILVFEGWDAAGKGGAIKRVSYALDPRGYEAVPIAAPDKNELDHHYLQRFWKRLPKTGHIAIFDRSWYGRVMVERIEGFTPEKRWTQAYREINEFEKELTDEGAVILKFWIHIDKDEQLKRFYDRTNDPLKSWKITDEDWRNREKWDMYEAAVDEMIEKTSTKAAPWHIIEGNNKLYSRIKVMNTVIDALNDRLDADK